MDDLAGALTDALTKLEAVADAMTPDEAPSRLDDATLQVFWRDWPHIASWAGGLWRRLNEDLAAGATPPRDPDLEEIGGEGG